MFSRKNQVLYRLAGKEYNIPKSKIADRISVRVLMGTVSGPNRYLNVQKEEELCYSIGLPRSDFDGAAFLE